MPSSSPRRLFKQQIPPDAPKPNLLSKRKDDIHVPPSQLMTRRPSPPPRSSSFSKRHASFDSPREVPLPSPQATMHSSQHSYFSSSSSKQTPNLLTKSQRNSLSRNSQELADFTPVFEEEDGWTSVDMSHTSGDLAADSLRAASQPSLSTALIPGIPTSSQILPFPRPYSVPHNNSSPGMFTLSTKSLEPSKALPANLDRMSSASLPLPSQVPYHSLPQAPLNRDTAHKPRVSDQVSELSKSVLPEVEDINSVEPGPYSPRPTPFKSDSSDSSVSSGSLASVSSNGKAEESPASSSGRAEELVSEPIKATIEPSSISSSSQERPRVALRDPPTQSLYDPVPTRFMDGASYVPATASRKSMPVPSTSSFPLPEPPTVLPPMEVSLTAPLSQGSSSTSTCSTCASADSGLSSPPSSFHTCGSHVDSSVSRSLSYPLQGARNSRPSSEPPYAPFLSHAPPPADSWIQVETTNTEYRLNVKLPGFKRDGITLASKKRRILHIVADSWDNGGGHFERRISFGYDADLVQVRAEFDGDMLKVVVPRRATVIMNMGSGAGLGYAS